MGSMMRSTSLESLLSQTSISSSSSSLSLSPSLDSWSGSTSSSISSSAPLSPLAPAFEAPSKKIQAVSVSRLCRPLIDLELSTSASFWALATQTALNRVSYGLGGFYRPELDETRCFRCGDHLYNIVGEQPIERHDHCIHGGRHWIDHLPLWSLGETTRESLTAVALDCEMVKTDRGLEVAQIVIIDAVKGHRILSWYVRPQGLIIDLLTPWSGIESDSVFDNSNAVDFRDLPTKFREIGLTSKTYIIGHGLESDFKALRLDHGLYVIDTAVLYPTSDRRRGKLRDLTERLLQQTIQCDAKQGHDPEEDAWAALRLARLFSDWSDCKLLRRTAVVCGFDIPPATKGQKANRNRRSQKRSKKMCHRCGCRGHLQAQCTSTERCKGDRHPKPSIGRPGATSEKRPSSIRS